VLRAVAEPETDPPSPGQAALLSGMLEGHRTPLCLKNPSAPRQTITSLNLDSGTFTSQLQGLAVSLLSVLGVRHLNLESCTVALKSNQLPGVMGEMAKDITNPWVLFPTIIDASDSIVWYVNALYIMTECPNEVVSSHQHSLSISVPESRVLLPTVTTALAQRPHIPAGGRF
jgi:hypothetical protein